MRLRTQFGITVFFLSFIIDKSAHIVVSNEPPVCFLKSEAMNLMLRHFSRVDALGFWSKVFILLLMRPQQRRFLAVESRNLWSYNSAAELPSSAGPQETHTHSHTCMYTHFLCYTFSIFLLSLSQHILPSPSSSMRFPDVFPVFSVSGLIQYSLQIKAARGRWASSIWTLWPPRTPTWPLTCLMLKGKDGCKSQWFTIL